MFYIEKSQNDSLPLYDVKELTLEEAMLVLAADKEERRRQERSLHRPAPRIPSFIDQRVA